MEDLIIKYLSNKNMLALKCCNKKSQISNIKSHQYINKTNYYLNK
jgi:hypothetical protein